MEENIVTSWCKLLLLFSQVIRRICFVENNLITTLWISVFPKELASHAFSQSAFENMQHHKMLSLKEQNSFL